MSSKETTLDDHSDLSRALLKDVEEFIKTVGNRNSTGHFDSVTTDGKYLKGRHIGQKPERFIEDHLIFPVLRTLGHSLRPQPVQYAPKWPKNSGIPDFSLTTIPTEIAKSADFRLFGESKTPNKLQYARNDVKEYLKQDLDFHAVVLLTDGIEWELWIRPQNQSLSDDYTPYREASLRDALGSSKALNMEITPRHPYHIRKQIDVDAFSKFGASAILDLIQEEFGFDFTEYIHSD